MKRRASIVGQTGNTPSKRDCVPTNTSPLHTVDEAHDLFSYPTSANPPEMDDSNVNAKNDAFPNAYAQVSQALLPSRRTAVTEIGNKRDPRVLANVDENTQLKVDNSSPENSSQTSRPASEVPRSRRESSRADDSKLQVKLPPRLMTVGAVAAYLDMSVSNVWRMRNAGVGFPNPVRIRGSTRWDKQAIDRFLDSLCDGKDAGV